MKEEGRLICCDWGTSNFRLYLVDTVKSVVIEEVKSDKGVSDIYKEYSDQESLSQRDFFVQYLCSQIEVLAKMANEKLAGVPVLASGMASSTIGITDVGYADLPFSIEHPQLNCEKIATSLGCPHDIYVFGGLKSSDDVMRGEEVQLLGLSKLIKESDCICILPGTHSKHVVIEKGAIQRFTTFMTGELFSIVVKHSILAQSVRSEHAMSQEDQESFVEGVLKGSTMNLLSAMFKIRTRDILHKLSSKANYFYLSGLMIGSELRDIKGSDKKVLLCGGDNLASYYEMALSTLKGKASFETISVHQMKKAIPIAHSYLYKKLKKSDN